MSSVRYYVDEHVGSAIVHGLRQRGLDVMTVIDVGTVGRADEIHMAFALNAGRTIFTQDSDFLGLLRSVCAMPESSTRGNGHLSAKSSPDFY